MKKETLYNCAFKYYTALKEARYFRKQLEEVLNVELCDNSFEKMILKNMNSMMFYVLQDYMGDYRVDIFLLEVLFLELSNSGEVFLDGKSITNTNGIIDWFLDNKENFDLLFPEENE